MNTKLLEEYIEKNFDFFESPVDTGLWKNDIKAYIDFATLKSLFITEDWVFICVDLIANKISAQELVIRNRDGIIEHELLKLFWTPNEYQNYHSFMYSLVCELFTTGNAFIWHLPANKQMLILPSEKISINLDKNGKILSYTFVPDEFQKKVLLSPQEVIHIKRPNPCSIIWGLSPLIPARKALLFNRYTSDYLNAFYLRQATPSMILEVDKTVSEEAALRLMRKFEQAFTGRKNQRRTVVLPKGVTAQVINNTIADQKIIELVIQNRELILGLLKIPKHEVGLQTAGSLGSEEYKTALKNFWQSTLIPTMKLIAGELSRFFLKNSENWVEFDLSGVDAFKEDAIQKAQLAIQMAQILTVNEVRKIVYELEPLNMTLADYPLSLKPQGGFITLSDSHQKLDTKALCEKAQLTYDDVLNSKEVKSFEKYITELYLSLVEIGANLSKKVLQQKDVVLYDAEKLKKELEKLFNEFGIDYADEYSKTLVSAADVGYDLSLSGILNKADQQKISLLKEKYQSFTSRLLYERGLTAFAHMSQTLSNDLVDKLTSLVEQNKTVDEVINELLNAYDFEYTKGSIERIVRTESLTAVSIGQEAMIEASKEVIPEGLVKAWVAANDERTRPSHVAVQNDGYIDVDAVFSNGLRYPRDPKARDASEVINCRCTLVVLPKNTV